MLKQLPSRSHKVKGFKVKHAVKICLLLVICIWLVYRLNHSHGEEALELSSAEKISGVTQNEHGVLVLGRRGLHPRVEEAPVDVERHRETEEEPEDEVDETKAEESEDRGIGLDEVDEHDHNTSDEDSEGVEDMINVDDTEREKWRRRKKVQNTRVKRKKMIQMIKYQLKTKATAKRYERRNIKVMMHPVP